MSLVGLVECPKSRITGDHSELIWECKSYLVLVAVSDVGVIVTSSVLVVDGLCL